MEEMLSFRRHKRKEFWISLFLEMSDKIGIDYDSLRAKEVVEFFYIMNKYKIKTKPQ